jgi:4-hydroxy-4-methyl-2-oxoglutarate aldolase
VLQDMDNPPGFAALFGEVHARICRSLGCVAYVSNGSVRDLQAIEPLGFQLFSGNVSPSHAYAHVVDFGEPVEIGGLQICAGDILHGDRNGILSIPHAAVGRLPSVAERIQAEEGELFELTDSPRFSVEALGERLRQFAERHKCV